MENFKEYIEGKTISLVGPAKYLKGKGYGKSIESSDIVIRINRGIESTNNYPKDLGTRTDILYSCLIEKSQQAGKLDPKELKGKYKINHIVAPPVSDYSGISNSNSFHGMVNMKTVKAIEKVIPIRLISSSFHTTLAKKVSCKPNTGFLSIFDLLSFNIKSLSIYGFSFYLDGFIDGQKSGVELEKNCTEQEFANMAFNSKRHIQKNMWKYASNNLLNNNKVKLDPILEKILSLESFSKNSFEEEVYEKN